MHNYNIRFIFVNINIKIKFGITLRIDETMGTGLMVHFLKGGIYKNELLTPSPRDHWVGHTDAWNIPGTEDLKPYITADDKKKKWLFGTVGMAVISAILSGIMCLVLR